MAASKGMAAVEWLSRRAREQRGGNSPQADPFDRSTPDALARWQDAYLDTLGARNYSAGTIDGRRNALKLFLAWAAERDLQRASQVTRPILEAYQRWLWRYTKANGRRLGWSTQRNRLSILKDWFRWLTRQNVILHNPASELELPRMEKRLPTQALSLKQMQALLDIPNLLDPLGIRDRAMLEGGADIRYIQQLLGHEKLETTAIYTEVSIRQLQEVHTRCHPAARLEDPSTEPRPAGAAAPPQKGTSTEPSVPLP